MISTAVSLRSSRGLSVISIRPLFSAEFTPSTPMNEERLVTSGSLRIDVGQRLLPARHLGEGDVLGRAGYALNRARVLDREEALGNLDILYAGQHDRPDRDNKNQSLVIEHPSEPVVICRR